MAPRIDFPRLLAMERLRLALSGAFFGYSTPIRASVYHQVWMAAAQRLRISRASREIA
jgi:hypothetical protein